MRENPFSGDITFLKGAEAELRRRVGAWRIILEVDAEAGLQSSTIVSAEVRTHTDPRSCATSPSSTRYSQYQRPRPYHPKPPNKKITTTMIKSVFVSMAVLSVFSVALREIDFSSTTRASDIGPAKAL